MSDAIVSLIRTYVAIWVAAGGVWLADRGVDLAVDAATLVLTGLVISVYYTVVRALEGRWPWLGVLLGSAQAPTYKPSRVMQGRVER